MFYVNKSINQFKKSEVFMKSNLVHLKNIFRFIMLDADLDIRQDLGELYKYFNLMNRYSARFNSKIIPTMTNHVAHPLVVGKVIVLNLNTAS